MKIINFQDIEKIFNNKRRYHIGYLTGEQLVKVRNFPIKEMGVDELAEPVEEIRNNGGICLLITQNRDGLCQQMEADYEDCLTAFLDIPGIETEDTIILNKKRAAVEAGMAQYGKNQITFDEYFGFDSQIDTWFIFNKVINLPKQKEPRYDFLSICKDCHDCEKACPAHAIHNYDNPPWLDRDACRHFCGVGDSDKIKTLKYKLNEIFNDPPFPDEIVRQLKSQQEVEKLYGIVWEGERFYRDKNGKKYFVNMDICRECCVQPKCSRYGGKFPYKSDRESFLLAEKE